MNESQKKQTESQTVNETVEKDEEKNKQNAFIRVVPNQKFVKLVVSPQTGQNQTSFQNVFLNIIPATALKTQEPATTVTTTINPLVVQQQNVKDNSNSNVFLNLNNTFQRFIPVIGDKEAGKDNKKEDVNVSKILTETKTEELSVEIDPTDFGCMSEDSPQQPSSDNNEKDWEDVITGTKIETSIDTVPSLVPINSDSSNFNKSRYVPIVPKPSSFSPNDEEKYEFFNGGHFLTPNEPTTKITELNFTCELCDRMFDTMKNLRSHIKQFHLGKFPYKCDFCYSEFANRGAYDFHIEKHNCPQDIFLANDSLTLKDFPTNGAPPGLLQSSDLDMQNVVSSSKSENEEPETHTCDVCGMAFQSANGLVRHKVRKHNQKTKKKYFIKGMKNARCDICNRDFSTQSYLQIHLKLHEKKGPNYRGKIFRNKYVHQQMQNGNNITESDVLDISKEGQEANGDIIEMHNPLLLDDDDDEENEIDDIPKALKLKINLRNLNRSDSPHSMEVDDDLNDSSINKALFSDISLECEQYLLEQQHNDRGNANFDCESCRKSFENKSDLKRYLNSLHSKSMQYKCHLCDSSFCEIDHLTKHLQIHYTSASCTICQQMYTDENEIEIHNEFHDNQANWQCGVCYFVNNEIKSLKEHINEHGNKILYRCHFCDKEFDISQDLNDHIDKHDGSHCCNECEKSFGYQHEKDIHDYNMHGKERHSCEICMKSYKSSHDLVRHKNLHEFHPHLLHCEASYS